MENLQIQVAFGSLLLAEISNSARIDGQLRLSVVLFVCLLPTSHCSRAVFTELHKQVGTCQGRS